MKRPVLKVTVVGNRVSATCDTCHTDNHRVVDMRTLRISTPTGTYGHTSKECRVSGGVTGRVETRRLSYPIVTTLMVNVCPDCGHRADVAMRRGLCRVSVVVD